MRRSLLVKYCAAILALIPVLGAQPATAQEVSTRQIDELARDVSRVESLRDVKDLQRFYAQYAQFGLWQEMADLFTSDAELVWGKESITGKAAIAAFLQDHVGGTRGLTQGAVHAEMIEEPLVNLSVDGNTAEGRWMGMVLAGDGRGGSRIEGGIYENDYLLDGGVWKISRLHYFPQYEGDYANGWTNYRNQELRQFPFHFTVDETGIPIPPTEGSAPASGATLSELEARIGTLNAEDTVRNLQNAYGYYVDRKMWDDVVELFAANGVVDIAGVGTFSGPEGIRTAMELMGPQGLRVGDLNDFLSFNTIVTVESDNQQAYARGFALGMLGDRTEGTAGWEFQIFRNRFTFEGGLWKIREMRLYPLLQASYSEGWANGGTAHLPHGMLPAFTEPHPVTGERVTIEGFAEAGSFPLTGSHGPFVLPASEAGEMQRFLDATRRLKRSWAYDGVVNVSSAYGYYIDDFHWLEMASIFAENGNKHSPFAGFYLGRDRVQAAATTMWGDPPELRSGISFHWRFQPVIHVSHDGRSANLRTRLWQPRTGMRSEEAQSNILYTPGFNTGMYPNDQAVLEDGIWRLWSLTIDEHYMTSANWKDGWAGVEPTSSEEAAGQSPLVERLPPDILMTKLGRRAEHFRGGTGETIAWPGILPMWFHYKNPVSGRVPELYWPDSVPGLLLPEARLINHGYQMPPNGPEQDGIHIELTPPEANIMDGE
jgi:hypothetical protein